MMNYYNPYQPYQPYLQNQNQMQGKMISNLNEITANDIPMNGMCAYFPMYDGSMINVRRWNNDGTISQMCYKPVQAVQNNAAVSSSDKAIEGQDDTLATRLDRIEALIKELKNEKSTSNDTTADE